MHLEYLLALSIYWQQLRVSVDSFYTSKIMKTIKTLDFQLNWDKAGKEIVDYCYQVRLKSTHISNYIERTCLRELKIKSEEYSGIIITLMHGYDDAKWSNYDNPFISPTKCVSIYIRLDKENYDAIKTDNDFREFIRQTMEYAFEKIEVKYPIPSKNILASYNDFKEKNFINEWLSKKKTDRKRKLLAEVYCKITTTKFILTLKVIQDKKEIYCKEIFKTDSNIYSYGYSLRKVVIEQDKILVLGARDKVTFSLPLKDILLD